MVNSQPRITDRLVTAEDIIALGLCSEYPDDRVRSLVPQPLHLSEILRSDQVEGHDRLWVALHLLSPVGATLVSCILVRHTPLADGRTVWDLLTDERSKQAIRTAERYVAGTATEADLSAAGDAARQAATAFTKATAQGGAWDTMHAAWGAASLTDIAQVGPNSHWAKFYAINAANRAANTPWDTQIDIFLGVLTTNERSNL